MDEGIGRAAQPATSAKPQGGSAGQSDADSRQADMDRLCRALLSLDSVAECAQLLDDLCTRQELEEMARRLLVASLLRRGENYQEIGRQTGVSTATISRVNRALRYGAGGYELALKRLDKQEPQL